MCIAFPETARKVAKKVFGRPGLRKEKNKRERKRREIKRLRKESTSRPRKARKW